MANNDSAVTRVIHEGDNYRVQGVHEGRPSDYRVSAADVQAIEKTEGRKGVEAFFHRSLAGGRVDQRWDDKP